VENIISPVLFSALKRRGYETISDIGGKAWLTAEEISKRNTASSESELSL